ncbi:BMP family ABC transporter substrate-binding protein [Kribbella qitaiheensis]|uniref:BMP family ABC transporter substrate-binding protein n=1 Tax=Kribbella qitaiheensis TaxID=1544730 RepID=A0A7G6X3L2_9ACTN|nr:BMP family ABC transporter substrate-binding protein [Kribbella qitaiheensis]QNE20827.1 BMP family ABC transporter substrate-binding protein [Kribbella qitaiheensis]
MKKYVRGLAIVSALTLAVAACGSKPTDDASSGSANKDFKACMVSDSGGFDDKSFNQTSYEGFQAAIKAKGLTEVKAESKSDNDYPTNMTAMVNAKCKVIVAVGFKLEDATDKAANANADIKFAIVDSAPAKPIANVKPLLFNTAQAAFQAGYLAAGMTQSGKVGTFGGIKIPPVTIYMDGFAEGVRYYNKQKSKNVQVLGWDDAKQAGLFTGDFEDKAKGQNTGQNLITQGADIIFPVAGPSGLGGLQAAKASNGKVNAIWVDTDGCVSAAEYCSVLISSVNKGMDVAVQDAVTSVVDSKYDSKQFIGTLENGGTSLAPFHDFDGKVPADMKTELDQIKADIISGKITIASKAQPAAS